MNLAQATLNDFARQLGLGDLALNEDGVASLSFESTGTLFVEQLDQSVLVYLVQQYDRLEPIHTQTALEMCHWRHNHGLQVNASITVEENLVFSTRMPEEDFDLPRLEQSLRLLNQLHDHVQSGTTV